MISLPRWLLSVALAALAAGPASATTWYVDNVAGKDSFDGQSAKPDGEGHGPFATIGAALATLQTSDRLDLANTGTPYREVLSIGRVGGTPEQPMVIDGHGATLDGLGIVPEAEWQAEADGAYSTPFKTNANKIEGSSAVTTWIGAPQIWFVDGKPAPNATERTAIAPGGFYWDKKVHRLYFRLPEGRKLAELKIEVPRLGTCVAIYNSYVVVRNLRAIHSLNDGYGTGTGVGLVFQNIIAEENCDQGFSAHGGTAVIEDAVLRSNAGSGITDVGRSVTLYRRCVVSDNTFESGAYFLEDGMHVMENCRLERNADGPQVLAVGTSPVHLINCLIRGKDGSAAPLIQATSPVLIDGCTLTGGRVGILVDATRGGLRLTNSLLADLPEALFSIAPGAEGRVRADCNLYAPGTLVRAGKTYAAADWETYRQESRQDGRSVVATPGAAPVLFDLPVGSPLRSARVTQRAPGVDDSRLPTAP